MKKQGGFTLIELVVVIVILGLLAATALPKFIDITSEARVASVKGVAGGLRAAAALGQAQYVVNGSTGAGSYDLADGTTVTALTETGNPGRGGRPTADAAGMGTAMPLPDGFTAAVSGTSYVYTPNGSASATCSAVYTPANTGDPVSTNEGC